MEGIVANAKAIACKLEKINESNAATEKELKRRVTNEKALHLGHIAARDVSLAPKSVINNALRSKLARLSTLVSILSPEIERVERLLTSLEHAPAADQFQQQRIQDLKRELADRGKTVSTSDLTAYLYKRNRT